MARKWYSFFPAIQFLSLLVIGGNTVLAQVPGVELLERQGSDRYQQGEYEAAIALWEQALPEIGDRSRQAALFNNLSLAHQHLGQWNEAKIAIQKSIQLLEEARDTSERRRLAHAREIEGKLNFAIGQPQAARVSWQKAAASYGEIGEVAGKVRSQIHQSLAMQELGLYREAFKTLTRLDPSLANLTDANLKSMGMRTLGSILLILGNTEGLEAYWSQFWPGEAVGEDYLEIANRLLEESFRLAVSSGDKGTTLLEWGNVARTAYFQAKDAYFRVENPFLRKKAIVSARLVFERYRKTREIAPDATTRLQAFANELDIALDAIAWMPKDREREEILQAIAVQVGQLPEIRQTLATLPNTRQTIYLRVHLAKSLLNYAKIEGRDRVEEVSRLLNEAARQGEELGDIRARSLALGYLGELHESKKQWLEARQYGERALLLAEQIRATDLAYRWQWQLGRVLKAQGEIGDAISVYESSIETLRSVRQDLVSLNNPDIRFFFRDDVEPVYRELVALLMDEARTDSASKQAAKRDRREKDPLDRARDLIEDLQLAELENFLRCQLSTAGIEVDRVADREDSQAAIIYPIILEDRLELIVKFPRQERLFTSRERVGKKEVEATVERVRKAIQGRKTGAQDDSFRQLHRWLLEPIETQLQANNIKTLVFVLDGALKNVPMSVLYDGEKYALEKYDLALNLGLKLSSDRSLDPQQMKILAAGISESRSDLPELPFVERELETIQANSSRVNVLLNEEFTKSTLQVEIKKRPFSVLHLATHGSFSSDPRTTYILAYDDRISMDEFSALLQQGARHGDRAVELLILSACQTAAGDKRAALGLAGVSIQAGAQSTLASLFVVGDRSTSVLMEHFYRELQVSGTTKAEALRKAQLALLADEDYRKPYFWSPYVLIGNWH